ncbi:fumarylacetoacetase [Acidicapsa acidisoli]|uniref:fumarylacetoacetase n=1 Tax=Acidicapsa acidisoli TaxID=1615681 RepID=UPI0021E05620|nr:fumarylacetoacetase [Acidicapsa acidisoli]
MEVSRESRIECWIKSANETGCDFPIENLPYGTVRHRERTFLAIAIGDRILNLQACACDGLFSSLSEPILRACGAELLNPLMSLGRESWSALRSRVTELLDANRSDEEMRDRVARCLIPMQDAEMILPAQIGDYTDFYASIHHATRVGKLFRPDNPLLPNYKYVPIGYHGRASSIVTSGTEIQRPSGQIKNADAEPLYAASQALDYELEIGAFIGVGNRLGQPIAIAQAEEHVFGLCLVNDWSARDLQSWEYQPLGPFLAKSFATTISPWIVPMEALAPYRVPAVTRASSDPTPLPYLSSSIAEKDGIELTLEVLLQSRRMREAKLAPALVSQGNLRDLYWTIRQLVTHHASNGCNLRPGDLLATGTVSGLHEGSEGCLLEMKHRSEPLHLPNGEKRRFLEDGDRVILRAYASKNGLPKIGFGDCMGTIV